MTRFLSAPEEIGVKKAAPNVLTLLTLAMLAGAFIASRDPARPARWMVSPG